MKSRSRKNKGKRLQNWVCERLSQLLGIPWGKDELIASRESGQPGVDIRLIGKARELIPFDFECKNQETWKLPEYIEQAKSNQEPRRDWLLVLKKNRFKPIIVMDAEVFFKILEEILEKYKKTGRQND